MARATGEAKRDRLKRISAQLRPGPEVSPYYVQVPDGEDVRAPGWYMRLEGETVYLGYGVVDAEMWIREQLRSARKVAG